MPRLKLCVVKHDDGTLHKADPVVTLDSESESMENANE